MKTLIPIFLLFSLGVGACKNQQNHANPPNERAAAGLTWQELASGNYSAVATERHLLVRSADEWAALWKELQANIEPAPPLPEVNFDQQILLACLMGTRNSGGYSVEVSSVEQKDKALLVGILYKEPGKNCVTTMALTQPFTVVALDNPGAETAEFTVETRKYDCEK